MVRTATNRVKSWTGTVHYAAPDGQPACNPVRTRPDWLSPSIATVTCKRCIGSFGADEPGHEDPAPVADSLVEKRVAERAARQAARFA